MTARGPSRDREGHDHEGHGPPHGAADMGASLLVTLNGLRLLSDVKRAP